MTESGNKSINLLKLYNMLNLCRFQNMYMYNLAIHPSLMEVFFNCYLQHKSFLWLSPSNLYGLIDPYQNSFFNFQITDFKYDFNIMTRIWTP